MKKILNLLIISVLCANTFAQSVTISPTNGSTLLDVKSTTQGFLLPRMTQAQRNAIINPSAGLQVYQTDVVAGIYFYGGFGNWWVLTGNQFLSSPFTSAGTNIYTTNTGNMGIGTSTPAHKLTIKTSSPNFGLTHTDGIVSMGTFENGASGQLGTRSNHRLSFFTNNSSEKMTLIQNGKLGLGTVSPLTDLHIKQSNETYPLAGGGLRLERKNTTDYWDIGVDLGNELNFNLNGVSKGYIRDNDGVYVVTSDLRLKKDIQPIGEVLPLVLKLEAKTYYYNDNQADAPLSYGFIAQEVEKLFPDFVTSKSPDGIKALAYQNIGVVAIKAMQEQQSIIDALLKRLEILENRK